MVQWLRLSVTNVGAVKVPSLVRELGSYTLHRVAKKFKK